MRIFLDANILFSASKSDGPVRKLLSMLSHEGHELCADRYVVEEAARNLALKSADSLSALEALLQSIVVKPMAVATARRSALRLPEKDQPVLEAAIRNQCDVLVTGDKTHFGAMYGSVVDGVEVLSPAQLAARLVR